MTQESVFCEAAIQPAAYPNGRHRTAYSRSLFSACAAVLVALPAQLSAESQDVTLTTCKGKISSSFGTLGINAEWAIDWIERANHIPPHVMTAVRKQICADTFGVLSDNDSETRTGLFSERLDYAQLGIFRRAAEMVAETDDSPFMRSLDFHAYLRILFVTDGYIVYRLVGYHNEGGNGCHSYVTARVLSLTTGKPLRESDLIPTNRFAQLYTRIVEKACEKEETAPFDPKPEYNPQGHFFDSGNFMIEPQGIRWYLSAYSVFPGCAGVVDTLLTWDELKPFFTEPRYLKAFRNLDFNSISIKRDE